MKRNEMLVNIIAQLVHSPDKTTATHIKNFISAPADQWDKPGLVAALWATLKDETEVDL